MSGHLMLPSVYIYIYICVCVYVNIYLKNYFAYVEKDDSQE